MKVKSDLIFIASIVQLSFNKVRKIICNQKNREIGRYRIGNLFGVLLLEEHQLTELNFHTLLLAHCPMIDGYALSALIFLETLSKHLAAIIYSVKNALATLRNVHCVIYLLLGDYGQMYL